MTTSRFLRWPLAALLLATPVRAGLYFTPAPAPEGADTSALAADGATLWAGTLRGVWKLRSGAWSFDGLSDKTVSSLAVFGGTVWAATGDGLWQRGADGTWSAETLPGDSSILNALATDGSALYAAGIGTFRNTGGTWAALAPAGGIVSSLTLFQGDLVAGVLGYGAVRYPGGTGLPVAMFLGLGVAEEAQAFTTYGGVLYAGTPRGVYAWNGMSWVGDAAYGLHNVRALASASGYLWAASVDGGVSRKSGSTWSDVNGGLLFPSAKSFALLGTDLYVGTAGAPIYRYSGGSWSPAGTGLNAATISEVLITGPDYLDPLPNTIASARGAGFGDRSGSRSDLVLPGCGDIQAATLTQTPPFPPTYFSVTNCGPVSSNPPSPPALTVAGLPAGAILSSVEAVIQILPDIASPLVLAGTSNAGIWRFSSGFWSEENAGVTPSAAIGVIRSVGNEIFAAGGLGVLRRDADGTWKDESTGLPFGATVFSFGGSSASGNPVFAGLATGGVYRLDPGPLWRQDAAGLPAATVFSLEAVGPRLFAAAGTGGLFRKTGGAWLREAAGL
ncbi:MAG: hypothetical protein ACM3JH_07215, partial [Acidithiobacillales bacterium]